MPRAMLSSLGAGQLWAWLVATAVLTVLAMVCGAAAPNQPLAALSGTMFAGVAAFVGWRFAAGETLEPSATAARFARLMALAWGWSGAAMLGCYYLTDLAWQHAWQYGLAMLLIAAALGWYGGQREAAAAMVSAPSRVQAARYATAAQGIAALMGVAFLVFSGKLDAAGRDWAANIVFVAVGLSIFALSLSGLRAERRALDG